MWPCYKSLIFRDPAYVDINFLFKFTHWTCSWSKYGRFLLKHSVEFCYRFIYFGKFILTALFVYFLKGVHTGSVKLSKILVWRQYWEIDDPRQTDLFYYLLSWISFVYREWNTIRRWNFRYRKVCSPYPVEYHHDRLCLAHLKPCTGAQRGPNRKNFLSTNNSAGHSLKTPKQIFRDGQGQGRPLGSSALKT